MSPLDRLISLGFTNSEIVGERRGVVTVRILTDKGWTYERFATAGDVDSWAIGKSPA